MTVKELKEKIKYLDDDIEVLLEDKHSNIFPADRIVNAAYIGNICVYEDRNYEDYSDYISKEEWDNIKDYKYVIIME